MRRLNQFTRSLLLAAALLLAAQSASAIVTVGPVGSGCDKNSIQAAITKVINQERAGGDVDPYIAVAGGFVYNEALIIDGSNVVSYNVFGTIFDHPFVQIYGNYDEHCSDVPNGSTAFVHTGVNIVGNSVLEIKGNRPVDVVLNHLILADAHDGVGAGGGINFHGSGLLDLSNVEITNNKAGYGGGIFAEGNAPGISVTLHSGMWIHHNTASHGGGGINIQGEARLFALEGQTLIEYNSANPADSLGLGGGLRVTGAQALADIGSPGYNGVPVVSNNNARFGGGISIEDSGIVRLFSTSASLPARIEYNTAAISGGGVLLNGGHLCGDGYSISHNAAQTGGAIEANASSINLTAQGITCNTAAFMPDHAPCAPGTASCNTIDGNVATSPTGDVIQLSVTDISADRVELNSNTAPRSLLSTTFRAVTLSNCLIAMNTTSELIVSQNGPLPKLELASCTMTGNIGLQNLFPFGPLILRQSILWQPGMPTVNADANTRLTDVISNDADALSAHSGLFGEFGNVHSYDPRFVDAANGDFRLQPDSPAIDYASSGPTVDLTGTTRPVALWPSGAPYDVGAYEAQSPGDVIFFNAFGR